MPCGDRDPLSRAADDPGIRPLDALRIVLYTLHTRLAVVADDKEYHADVLRPGVSLAMASGRSSYFSTVS